MGDRANVKVLDDCRKEGEEKPAVFLYTHWSGTELAETVQRALQRRVRWDDSPYLARIIFCAMVEGQEAEETGFGISTDLRDNEHRIIVVDPQSQRLTIEPEDADRDDAPLASFTFEEFCALDSAALARAYGLGDG